MKKKFKVRNTELIEFIINTFFCKSDHTRLTHDCHQFIFKKLPQNAQ